MLLHSVWRFSSLSKRMVSANGSEAGSMLWLG